MTELQPGFNIVSKPVDTTLQEMSVLQLLRAIENKEQKPTWVTVTGLDTLLQYTVEKERDSLLAYINRKLAQINIGDPIGVQFYLSGDIAQDERVYIKPSTTSSTRIYLDALFREPPQPLSGTHYWSKRA